MEATYTVIVEDSKYEQHKSDFKASTQDLAESVALHYFSEKLGQSIDSLSVLVSIEMLTEDQCNPDLPPTGKVFIKSLTRGKKFKFNDTIYTVQKKYRNDDSPLISVCGQMFHHEDLPVELIP